MVGISKINIAFNLIGNSNGDGWSGATMIIDEDLNSTNGNEIKFTLESGSTDKIEVEGLYINKTYKIYFNKESNHSNEISFQMANNVNELKNVTNSFNAVDSTNPYYLIYQNNKWGIENI